MTDLTVRLIVALAAYGTGAVAWAAFVWGERSGRQQTEREGALGALGAAPGDRDTTLRCPSCGIVAATRGCKGRCVVLTLPHRHVECSRCGAAHIIHRQ